MGKRLGVLRWPLGLLLLVAGVLVFAYWGVPEGRTQGGRLFTGNVESFPVELQQAVQQGEKPDKEKRAEYEQFEQLWKQQALPAEVEQRVATLSVSMARVAGLSRAYFREWYQQLLYYLQHVEAQEQLSTIMTIVEAACGVRNLGVVSQLSVLRDAAALVQDSILHEGNAFSWGLTGQPTGIRTKPELMVEFQGVDLACRRTGDSILIFNTSGCYYPLRFDWEGRGGEVRWLRSDFDPAQVHAQLEGYRIDMTKTTYSADSAVFTNTNYFDSPVKGRLVDKLTKTGERPDVVYPEFHTYGKDYTVKSHFPGVEFRGGCIMQGSQLIGVGTHESPVRFRMERNDSLFIKLNTLRMAFRPTMMVADNAEVTIYLKGDSLYHNGLRFEYYDPEKVVRLRGTNIKTTHAPIYSSYHKMSIYFDELSWKVGSDKLIFGPQYGSTQGQAYFQSDAYFKSEPFDRLMGMSYEHPLLELEEISKWYGGRTIPIKLVAERMRKPLTTVRRLLMDLSVQGYLLYDIEAQEVTLLDRMFRSIQAKFKEIDYDAIEFSSQVGKDQANAVLDLNNADLDVYSVPRVSVSDSQNVNIIPRGRYVKLQKNRDFQFDGTVNVGLFTFMGDSMHFDYEHYTIDLTKVDSAYLHFQLEDSAAADGSRATALVRSKLEELTGFIYIDDPNNKAGLRRNEGYPLFKSTKPSKVYYNNTAGGNPSYSKEKLRFEVDTFTFHNMFRIGRKDISFPGRLEADSLLDAFRDTLVLCPDTSLGFVHPTPPEGIPLYNGKARFYENLMLSGSGLRGDGKLTFLNSTTRSHDFVFHPDSMVAKSTEFNIAGKKSLDANYPDVYGGVHNIKWVPADGEFHASRGQQGFGLYDSAADFQGDITYTAQSLLGSGTVGMRKAKMTSENFVFENRAWHSDSMGIRFFVELDKATAFSADKVRGEVDYDSRSGEFGSISSAVVGNMEALGYQCLADTIFWPIDGDEIRLTTSGVQQLVDSGKFKFPRAYMLDSIPQGSIFYSVVPQEDSLYFAAPQATYLFTDPYLKADGVKEILVADAMIYPDNFYVGVKSKERMLPLNNATLYFDKANLTHRVYAANLMVYGGYSYAGKGKIDYVSDWPSPQVLNLDTIQVLGKGPEATSHAYSQVDSAADFHLSQRFSYEGQVEVDSHEPQFLFTGAAKPIYECYKFAAAPLRFSSRLKADSIMIPYGPKPRSSKDSVIVSGIMLSYVSTSPYGAFVSNRRSRQDLAMMEPVGKLTYNTQRGRFQLADSAKFVNVDTVLSFIEMDPTECRLFASGPATLPFDLGQVHVNTTLSGSYDVRDSSVNARAFIDFDFLFLEEALKMLAADINARPDLTPLDEKLPSYQQGLRQRLPYKEFMKTKEQIDLFGLCKEPLGKLEATISLGDVQLRWDRASRSYVSMGALGITSIAGVHINKRVDGFLEMYKRVSGDYFILYLELAPDVYYLFHFTGETMYTVSSNSAYLAAIDKEKARKRRKPADKSGKKYVYTIGTNDDVESVHARYRGVKSYH